MRYWLLSFHLSVLGAVAALVTSLDLTFIVTGAAVLIVAGPLALAVRGLCADSRYTQQWLSIAMVFYIGLGLVETIASQAQSLSAIVVLLASGVELALLFVTLRRAPPASRGSTES
jgi:uncharacterized membrane protein